MKTSPSRVHGKGSVVQHCELPELSETAPKSQHSWLTYPPRERHRYGAAHARQRRLVLAEEPSCRLCGAPSNEVDHIEPKCRGGSDERSNLQALCRGCHLTKSGREANHQRWHVHKIYRRKEPANG